MGQMGDVYVVAEGPDGLYLIDQHAAHERVLFEQVRDAVREGVRESQALLEPASVELTYTQQELARESREALEQYGFVLEEFGERSYLLRGVPSTLNDSDPAQGLREVLDLMSTEFRLMERRDGIAASIACHGAIRAGKSLGTQEMTELVRQLEGAENPNTCPHGRPTMIRLSVQHLERQFGRR
jgi:DNA mismatch repair protein MutL